MIFPKSFNGLSGNSFCISNLCLKTIDKGSFICYISGIFSLFYRIMANLQLYFL